MQRTVGFRTRLTQACIWTELLLYIMDNKKIARKEIGICNVMSEGSEVNLASLYLTFVWHGLLVNWNSNNEIVKITFLRKLNCSNFNKQSLQLKCFILIKCRCKNKAIKHPNKQTYKMLYPSSHTCSVKYIIFNFELKISWKPTSFCLEIKIMIAFWFPFLFNMNSIIAHDLSHFRHLSMLKNLHKTLKPINSSYGTLLIICSCQNLCKDFLFCNRGK